MNQRERRIANIAALDDLHVTFTDGAGYSIAPGSVGLVVDAIERADAEAPEPDRASQAADVLDAWIAGVSSWLASEISAEAAEGFEQRARFLRGAL